MARKQPDLKTAIVGCILPGGNSDQWPGIRQQLRKLRVPFAEARIGGGMIWLVLDDANLPEYVHAHRGETEARKYLPTCDDSGHTVYPITAAMVADMQRHR